MLKQKELTEGVADVVLIAATVEDQDREMLLQVTPKHVKVVQLDSFTDPVALLRSIAK